jgi:hypothetical protein
MSTELYISVCGLKNSVFSTWVADGEAELASFTEVGTLLPVDESDGCPASNSTELYISVLGLKNSVFSA